AERKTDGELLERNVDDPSEDRRAFFQPDDADGIRRVGGVSRRRHADDGVARERAIARERDRLPGVGAAARAELFRRNRNLAAPPALDAGEVSFAHPFEEPL